MIWHDDWRSSKDEFQKPIIAINSEEGGTKHTCVYMYMYMLGELAEVFKVWKTVGIELHSQYDALVLRRDTTQLIHVNWKITCCNRTRVYACNTTQTSVVWHNQSFRHWRNGPCDSSLHNITNATKCKNLRHSLTTTPSYLDSRENEGRYIREW